MSVAPRADLVAVEGSSTIEVLSMTDGSKRYSVPLSHGKVAVHGLSPDGRHLAVSYKGDAQGEEPKERPRSEVVRPDDTGLDPLAYNQEHDGKTAAFTVWQLGSEAPLHDFRTAYSLSASSHPTGVPQSFTGQLISMFRSPQDVRETEARAGSLDLEAQA